MRKNDDVLESLQASRRLVEERLQEVRHSMKSEVGWAPSSRSWIVLTLALSSGIALAYLMRSRRT